MSSSDNPCVSCGACCTRFRVSFYWAEADDAPGGTVPAGLTEPVGPHMRAMLGTHPPKRCIALQGQTGHAVSCGIYPLRPTPCREFAVWEPDGTPNPRCNQARAAIGLPPLAALPVQSPGNS